MPGIPIRFILHFLNIQKTGVVCDPFLTPEMSAIPDMLIEGSHQLFKDEKEHISKKQTLTRQTEIAHRENERIWRIMNA